MPLPAGLVEELSASFDNIDGPNLRPIVAAARAARIAELLKAAPQNRALFLTLAAIAVAGASGCGAATPDPVSP